MDIESLRINEERFRSMLDNILEGCQIIGFDWRYIYLNHVAEEHSRLPGGYLPGRKYQDTWPGCEQTELFRLIDHTLRDRVPHRIENEFSYPDGKVGWFELSIQPAPEGVYIFSIDITERKTAERALRESEQKFRETIFNLDEGFYSITPEGRLLAHNQAFNRILGFETTEDLRGLFLPDFWLRPDQRAEYLASLASDGFISKYPVDLTTKTGKRITIMASAHMVKDKDFRPQRIEGVFVDISELKAAENALREGEEKYRALLWNLHTGVVVHAPDTSIIFSNPKASELLGLTEEQLQGKKSIDPAWFFIMEDGTRITTEEYPVSLAMSTARPVSEIVLGIVRPDRESPTWVQCSTHAERNADGELQQVIVTFFDITQIKLAETALWLKNLVFDASIAANSIASPVGVLTEANNTFLRTWGYTSKEEVIGRPLVNFFWNPADAGNIMDMLDANGAWEGDFEAKRRDGSVFIAHGMASVVMDGKGKVIGYQSAVLDITDRKQVEDALLNHSVRLRNLHEIDLAILRATETPEAIVQAALKQLLILLQCDITSVRLLDAETQELQVFAAELKSGEPVQPEKMLSKTVLGEMELLRQGKTEIVEDMTNVSSSACACNMLTDGEIKSCINVPLQAEKGLMGILHVGWDSPRIITAEEKDISGEVAGQVAIAIEQARLLKESKRYAAELEERVRQRTSQLMEANKELEAFSYTVSHDLRAPLRGIHGFTQILLDDYACKLDEEGRRICSIIQENSLKMGNLIEDLLEFSRLGRTEMQLTAINMKTLVDSVFLEMTDAVTRERITLNIDKLCKVKTDAVMMRQVWSNLLSNAIKYSSKKEKSIISITSSIEKGKCIFCIKDNGAGFDMQYIHKLFGVFQRLHSVKDFEGTGVGLAIVQHIVKRHGGEVWAEGETDIGASFYFSLPLDN